jgi:predicted NUDIX family phosphoesterase
MNPSDENVLVIKRSLFDELGAFQGLNFEPRKYLDTILSYERNFFLRRKLAEGDPSHKQIIPYVLLVHGEKVFYYVRGKRAGEHRLIAKGSIGIGGHLNEGDAGLFHLDEENYNRVVEREVHEEIHLLSKFQNRIVGLINDDSNEVGQVHLGVVHLFRLAEPNVEKREQMITTAGFLTKEELVSRRDSLETWSQICLDSLEQLMGRRD